MFRGSCLAMEEERAEFQREKTREMRKTRTPGEEVGTGQDEGNERRMTAQVRSSQMRDATASLVTDRTLAEQMPAPAPAAARPWPCQPAAASSLSCIPVLQARCWYSYCAMQAIQYKNTRNTSTDACGGALQELQEELAEDDRHSRWNAVRDRRGDALRVAPTARLEESKGVRGCVDCVDGWMEPMSSETGHQHWFLERQ